MSEQEYKQNDRSIIDIITLITSMITKKASSERTNIDNIPLWLKKMLHLRPVAYYHVYQQLV